MTDRPGLAELQLHSLDRFTDELLERAYDAGRLHANEELKRLLHANCTPGTNPGAQRLANEGLRLLGERGEAK